MMSSDDSDIDGSSKGGRYTDDGSYFDSNRDMSHKRRENRHVEEMRQKSAAEKRIRDLEEKVIEMEETNRKLREGLQAVKKKLFDQLKLLFGTIMLGHARREI